MVDWGYCSGWIRSLENSLLSYQGLLRWSEASNREAFLKYISDSSYGDYFNADNLEQYETVFERHFLDLNAQLRGVVPDEGLLRLHGLVYDTNNMKIILKAKLTGTDVKWEVLSDNGIYPPEDLFTLIEEKQYSRFSPSIAGALHRAEEEYKKTGNLQLVDFVMDKGVNDYRFELLDNPDYASIRDYYRAWTDLENIKNTFRSKRMEFEKVIYLEVLLNNGFLKTDFYNDVYGDNPQEIAEEIGKTAYGEVLATGLKEVVEKGRFGTLEKQADEYLARKLLPFRYVAQGPEVLEEFLSLKKLEMKNLKILFIGKLNDIPAEEIKTRIRRNDI